MACMGPPKPTDIEVDNLLEEVMALLKEKKILTMLVANSIMLSHRKPILAKLREVLAEILWQDACETF